MTSPQPQLGTPAPGTVLPRASGPTPPQRRARRIVAAVLTISGVLSFAYAGLSLFIATQLIYQQPKALDIKPADLKLDYRDVAFPSRDDHLTLKGWFIPGLLSNGQPTVQRTLIMVHGAHTNRADQKGAGLLDLAAAVVHKGFAVLTFDMRGHGESDPAPFSLGYFEQRDVLGAVDFLRSGQLPYPELGRPRAIGGWGVSMGAATLLFAAAREPAIQAVVSDSAYADIVPILEREVPKGGGLPGFFTPGALLAARALYGVDFYAVRPVDVAARIAPRPLFFIHGDHDPFTPPVNMTQLVGAASAAPNAHVQSWLVPGVNKHAQSFHKHPDEYVDRVVSFFTTALGPVTGAA